MVPLLSDDLVLGLDRVRFAEQLGINPDPWQRALLRSTSKRVLLNITRQGGKSTTAAVIALHRALYYPQSLVLVLAPALRQSQELFGTVRPWSLFSPFRLCSGRRPASSRPKRT